MAVTPEWARILNTTIHDFVRDEEINIMRNRKWLAMMQDRGRVSFNHEGDLTDWKVRYKRSPMIGYADSDTLTFARRNRWQTAQLEWRGYSATDSMTKLEKLKNKGTSAIVKIASEIASALMDDMDDQFGDELYIDGGAAGNSKRIHGIESFMAYSAASTTAPVALPSSTYGGLSCVLGNYGGSFSSTWPTGTGDAHYDFWSPLIVSYTSTVATASGGWAATTKTWPNTCKEAMRFGIIKSKKNKSKKGMLDMYLLNDDLYRQFLTTLDAEERLTVTRSDSKKGLYALGFTDTVNFDGVDVAEEYGVPSTFGYGLSMENMELRSLQPALFVPDEVDFDISTQSDRYAINFFGNMRFNPRYFVSLKPAG